MALFYSVILQDRLDAILVAAGAKVMHGLGALHRWLYAISQRSRSQFVQLVTFLLMRPVFELHNLGFKVAFSGNNRRIIRLYGDQFLLNVENDTGQLGGLSRYRRIRLEREQTLRNLRRALDGAKRASDAVNHGVYPVVNGSGKHTAP